MEWETLRAALPWLGLLPDGLIDRLAVEEFAVPDAAALVIVRRVQAALPATYLMTYRADATTPAPGRVQLCQLLRPAELAGPELAVLQSAERRLAQHRLTLCAYARPLSFRVRWLGPVC